MKDITSKYSGYDWLGDIPRDWIISKNRYYLKHKKTGKNESNNTKVLSLTTKGVKVKENLSDLKKIDFLPLWLVYQSVSN